jgi:hypothetical protein
MQTFPVHTIESAPEQSKPYLEKLQGTFGMIPNILGAMSASPVLIGSLVGLFQKVHGGSMTGSFGAGQARIGMGVSVST